MPDGVYRPTPPTTPRPEKPVATRVETSTHRSYATFGEWEADLHFGPYVEDEVIEQVRKVARQAWDAGFEAGLFSVTTTVTGSKIRRD